MAQEPNRSRSDKEPQAEQLSRKPYVVAPGHNFNHHRIVAGEIVMLTDPEAASLLQMGHVFLQAKK